MKRLITIVLSLVTMFSCMGITVSAANETVLAKKPARVYADKKVVVGIAWRGDPDSEFYTNAEAAIKQTGAVPVMLKQASVPYVPYDGVNVASDAIDENDVLKEFYGAKVKRDTYKYTDMAAIMEGIDAVVFTGGEDIAPTLYEKPVPWHGIGDEKDYNAARDISDYLTMAYCLDNDIPFLGLCRGSQMLAVISGAKVIQDIPEYYESMGKEYDFIHRNNKLTPDSYRDYSTHPVSIVDKNSIMYRIVGNDVLNGCPSWHHQAADISPCKYLKMTSATYSNGIAITESSERTDKSFAVGLQYHPEAAIVKHLNNAANKDNYMSYLDGMKFFMALKVAAAAKNVQLTAS